MFDVLTIGTGTRDVFLRSKLFKVIHDPAHLQKLGFPTGDAQCFALGGKIEVEAPVLTVGGGAANAAVTFARQGFRAAAVMKLGKDPNGRAVLEDLRKEHVSSFPIFDEGAMTAYSVILLSPNGERTILNHRGASEDLEKKEIAFGKLTARWAYIVPGRIPLPTMLHIIAELRKRRMRIAMNPSGYYLGLGAKKLMPILKHLDVISVNREEGAALTGYRYEKEREIFKRFDEWVNGIAVMTDGPKGVLVSDGARLYSAGVFKERKMVDRTGAGDAFGSGFVAGLMRASGTKAEFGEHAVREAIRLGSANATSVVEAIGAEPGILRRRAYESDPRWRRFRIDVRQL